MENRTIYLSRHGKIQLEDNQRRYIGQLDIPLSEEGIQQAKRLRKFLEPVTLSGIFSSDLSRCQQTAQMIADGRSLVTVVRSDLREIHMGKWEGRTFADILSQFPSEFKTRGADIGYYRVPGGESFADCQQRVMSAFHDLMNSSSGDVLFVGHAGVNRLLLCSILGMPLVNLFKIRQDYGCLNMISCNHNTNYQVKLLNFRP